MTIQSERFLDDLDELSVLVADLHRTTFLLLITAHGAGTIDVDTSSQTVLDLNSDITRILHYHLKNAAAATCELKARQDKEGIVKP